MREDATRQFLHSLVDLLHQSNGCFHLSRGYFPFSSATLLSHFHGDALSLAKVFSIHSPNYILQGLEITGARPQILASHRRGVPVRLCNKVGAGEQRVGEIVRVPVYLGSTVLMKQTDVWITDLDVGSACFRALSTGLCPSCHLVEFFP